MSALDATTLPIVEIYYILNDTSNIKYLKMPLHLTKFSGNSHTIFPVANNYRSFIALPRAKDEQCRWNAVAKRCFSASICNCLQS